jgi:hypothetical protein
MVDEGTGGGGEELVGANIARRRRPAHAGREPQRRRAVYDANIGPCGRGVFPSPVEIAVKPMECRPYLRAKFSEYHGENTILREGRKAGEIPEMRECVNVGERDPTDLFPSPR